MHSLFGFHTKQKDQSNTMLWQTINNVIHIYVIIILIIFILKKCIHHLVGKCASKQLPGHVTLFVL